ncbi:MAG: glutamine--fructose-6-phosphate transaminase (isomerizing) [Vicinamibacterales bacterium]|nr:glutamine--fructose-6-phosphate transaminase (isomerizing) [Vicinamibacterales bacterium]
MCGIIGYVGTKPALPVLIEGLRRMEYRGYDSAGVALVSPGRIEIRRAKGKLSNLEAAIKEEPVDGVYGIGHTRWATHGRPTEENAHPHRDCTGRVVVVHNGIIENYLELKAELQASGHTFRTETDTEIVAHLVEREMGQDGLAGAVQRALKVLRGMFAIVLVSVDDQNTIVAARSGPPIVVGLGDGEFFVASDIPAVLSHTRDVVFLDDGEMAVITLAGVRFTDFAGSPLDKKPERVTWDPLQAEKGGHRHFMLKEIHEQPTAAQDTIIGRISLDRRQVFLEELNLSQDVLASIQKVTIVACGTSWHAGLVGKHLIEALAGIPVEVDYGSEYRYRSPVVLPGTLVIAITQSGETADTLAALREARRRGARSVAICNVVGSMATRETEGTVYTHAGPEIGVASTKAFTSQLVALQLLALYLAQARHSLSGDEFGGHLDALLGLPHLIEETLKVSAQVERVAERFASRTDFLFLGRGINYPIALEGALKLKEISYIHAEGYPAGEMKHGPIALIDENMPIVAIATRDHVFEKMMGNVQEAKARGGSVIAVTSQGEERMRAVLDPARDVEIQIPVSSPLLTPVIATVPMQLLAYYIAVRRGCDVDQPRNLAKSVTVE